MTDNPSLWRARGDALLFVIGAFGAGWEIFYDHSENKYVYILILVLLRGGTGIIDRILKAMGK